VTWDLHYPPPAGSQPSYPISATPGDTEPEPKGPWVVPGTYTVKLTASGKSYTQPLVVRMDPRVKSGTLALQQQFTLSKKVYDAIAKIQAGAGATGGGRGRGGAGGGGGRGRGGAPGSPSLASVAGQLSGLYGATQEGSTLPPAQTAAAVNAALRQYESLMAEATTLLGRQ